MDLRREVGNDSDVLLCEPPGDFDLLGRAAGSAVILLPVELLVGPNAASADTIISQEYRVEGPVAIMMTTTAIDVDEELLSRCIVLSVDEGPEQTKAIHEKQRAEMSLEGRLRRHERARLLRLHQNVQRLVRPLLVVNPFASEMAYSDHRVRARRDHRKLLGIIETVALLHQHQRDVKTIEHGGHAVEYIEVEKTDIEIATKFMTATGGPSADDLPPQTRTLLTLLDHFVKERSETASRKHVRFTRREIREAFGLGDTQAKVHLRRLVENEYLIVHAAHTGAASSTSWPSRTMRFRCTTPIGRTSKMMRRAASGARSAHGRGRGGPSPTTRSPVKVAPIVLKPAPTVRMHVSGTRTLILAAYVYLTRSSDAEAEHKEDKAASRRLQ